MRKSPLSNEDKPTAWAPRGGTSGGGGGRKPDRLDANAKTEPSPSNIKSQKPTGGSAGRKSYPNLGD